MSEQSPEVGRVVSRQVTLDASPEVVWKALTDARELTRWFPLDAKVTPGAGGVIWMSWEQLYDAESRIEIWEPGKHLRLRFPNHAPYLMSTDYHLEGKGGRTVLRVVTSGFGQGADWDGMYGGVMRGWDFELAGLELYLARHVGTDRRVAHARQPMAGTTGSIWPRVVGPNGLFDLSPESPATGAPVRLVSSTGDRFEGPVVAFDPPSQVVMVAANWNDALLRIEIESHTATRHATVWLSSYGLPAADVMALQGRWIDALTTIG